MCRNCYKFIKHTRGGELIEGEKIELYKGTLKSCKTHPFLKNRKGQFTFSADVRY
jgi:hypothetical protein